MGNDFSTNTPEAFTPLTKKTTASERITHNKSRNEIITEEVHVTNGVRQVMVKDMKRGHTHGYLGAMNTCPSDSKLFGSSASKSATERGKIIQEEQRAERRGAVGKQQLFFRGVEDAGGTLP